MQLTRQADYAARAIVYLAVHPQANITDIAREQQVPREYMAKILQKLADAGITRSQRGVGGGISLEREPKEINLLDVIEAVEGPVALNRCLVRPHDCPREGICSLHRELQAVQRNLRRQLKAIDFATLARKETSLLSRGK